ncbi:hypothetical protein F5880DRAFT_1572967 [Lentinula raphanica]|nr:hypothetical protein F5880DRAFT_1572967 [Lentinula raphanica]
MSRCSYSLHCAAICWAIHLHCVLIISTEIKQYAATRGCRASGIPRRPLLLRAPHPVRQKGKLQRRRSFEFTVLNVCYRTLVVQYYNTAPREIEGGGTERDDSL